MLTNGALSGEQRPGYSESESSTRAVLVSAGHD